MKIVAIIPARAGSKGIPNKNIRILNGHPLVYYSIKNAMDSKWISEVVVTTDSEEVRIIALQMGAKVHWRKPELCADDVTLDAVIFDAIDKEVPWDYIVTMQPTSPTLKVETLDAAIDKAIQEDYDTLISAINKPHLSWRREGEKIVPNYEARLNRQYLPANYAETGAFVISKYEVVTENTRIGKKINVFEISEKEATDVDSFADLYNVTMEMENPRVAIYVNGNNTLGLGHIYRVLEVADLFYSKPDIYYDETQTPVEVFGNTTHFLKPVRGVEGLFEALKKESYDIFINDILTTEVSYMESLRKVLGKAKIVNFEDDGAGSLKADLVFNALYEKSHAPKVKAGEKFYIASKLFLFYEPITISSQVKNVFICFGGADPQNYSDRILRMLVSDEKYRQYHFTLVLGRAKKNVQELMIYNDYDHIDVLYDVKNMPQLMAKADIAITSRGRTGYELAIMGLPSIALAQNEREEKHSFVSNENGFTYIGLHPSDEVIQGTLDMYLSLSQQARQTFQDKLLKHDLKNGRRRIFSLIHEL